MGITTICNVCSHTLPINSTCLYCEQNAEYEESLIIDREKSLYPQVPHSPFPTTEFENQQQQQVPLSNPFTTQLLTTTNDQKQS